MKTKETILKLAKKKGKVFTQEVVALCGISRQTAHQHIRELVARKKLLKIGKTTSAYYVPYTAAHARAAFKGKKLTLRKSRKNLQEDIVFREIAMRLNLSKELSPCAFDAVHYAFTEMVNNAIDHSHSKTVLMTLCVEDQFVWFSIADTGIGVFNSIRKRFTLPDDYSALEHLMKGKQTTDPAHHSGQGIFFTSKTADYFSIESACIKWIVDNRIGDLFVQECRPLKKGTNVYFSIKKRSRRKLRDVFNDYCNEDYVFDKTQVMVNLCPKEGAYVSRSEAKRVLVGLEKFDRVVFDFRKVDAIGQGFADEIFRVYKQRYPGKETIAVNMNNAVAFMVGSCQKPYN
jgi:anti-sigma regulatory factor (Ser/Thr protein kinase)